MSGAVKLKLLFSSKERWEKGVVISLQSHGRQGAVAGTENCLGREGENLFSVRQKAIGVGNLWAAHGSGEEGVSNHGNRALKPMDDIGDSAGSMTLRQSCRDGEVSNLKILSRGKCGYARDSFLLADPCLRSGLLNDSIQIEEMIAMAVCQQEKPQFQLMRAQEIQHLRGICPCVEGDGLMRRGIPSQVGVNFHVTPVRGEHGHPCWKMDWAWMIFPARQCEYSIWGYAKGLCDGLQMIGN